MPEDMDMGHEAVDTDSDGYALFIATGCAACHGDNAEGTDAAPALPGHTEDQVLRQVRAPIGLMPVFPPDKISNQELATLAEWVGSLSGGHAHARPADVGQVLAHHHWMALFALEGDSL
jgi:mono/diheme cytochrome c family protein